MELENQQDKIVEQLEILNSAMVHQSSFKYVLKMGVVYGIGFFIGSAILATIALGVLGPLFGKIEWVRTNFEKGNSILR